MSQIPWDGFQVMLVRRPRRTEVYDTYWRFAAERQQIFFRRLNGGSPPWTGDSILRAHRFTNVYRAADRVSQYLIRHVIYAGDQSPREVLFRILMFKLFNKIETLEYLTRVFGQISYEDFDVARYGDALARARAEGLPVYSAAYIMPSAGHFGRGPKHLNHLRLIKCMMEDDLPDRVGCARSMQEAYAILLSYPSIGPFLAYQLVTDINYGTMTDFSESEFVMAGPGARDGLRKCFTDTANMSDGELIQMATESQEAEFSRLELRFDSLWGRPLQLIDCQNLFCEVDKYARVRHPGFSGSSGRKQIKRRFVQSQSPLPEYWFPPKWGLNGRLGDATPEGINATG